jgi:hypothetical protein
MDFGNQGSQFLGKQGEQAPRFPKEKVLEFKYQDRVNNVVKLCAAADTVDLVELLHELTEILNEEFIFLCFLRLSNTHDDESLIDDEKKQKFKGHSLQQINQNMNQVRIDHLLQALIEVMQPNIDWIKVCRSIDCQYIHFKDDKAFQYLLNILQRTANSFQFHLPRTIFFGRWSNVSSQILFVKKLFECGTPKLVNLHQYKKKIIPFTFKQDIRYD